MTIPKMGKYRTGIYVLIYLQYLCTDQGMWKTCGRLLDSVRELSDDESKHVWMWLCEVKYGSWQSSSCFSPFVRHASYPRPFTVTSTDFVLVSVDRNELDELEPNWIVVMDVHGSTRGQHSCWTRPDCPWELLLHRGGWKQARMDAD